MDQPAQIRWRLGAVFMVLPERKHYFFIASSQSRVTVVGFPNGHVSGASGLGNQTRLLMLIRPGIYQQWWPQQRRRREHFEPILVVRILPGPLQRYSWIEKWQHLKDNDNWLWNHSQAFLMRKLILTYSIEDVKKKPKAELFSSKKLAAEYVVFSF